MRTDCVKCGIETTDRYEVMVVDNERDTSDKIVLMYPLCTDCKIALVELIERRFYRNAEG